MKSVETHLTHKERPFALEQAILACRPASTVSLPGIFIDAVQVSMGVFVGTALTLTTGQTHVQRYLKPLMARIENKEIDPSFLITHRVALKDGPEAYETFRDKQEGCIKVGMRPQRPGLKERFLTRQ